MSNVEEFIRIRERIEFLGKEIDVLLERKSGAESKTRLDEATELLTTLTAMADSDVRHTVITRLTRLLAKLGTKAANPKLTKKRVVKAHPVS